METEAQRAKIICAGQALGQPSAFRGWMSEEDRKQGCCTPSILDFTRAWVEVPVLALWGLGKAAPCLGFSIYRLNKILLLLRQLERWNEIMWALLISPEHSGTKWLILVEHTHLLDPRATSSPTSGFYSVRPPLTSWSKRPTPPQLSWLPSLLYHQLIY